MLSSKQLTINNYHISNVAKSLQQKKKYQHKKNR